MRAPLLGVFALLAEWQALLDPGTERSVAQIKLAWWHDEMLRLVEGDAVHPISLHLAAQPAAAAAHFKILTGAVQAAILEHSGVPLEFGTQLEAHSEALIAGPLRVASLIAEAQPECAALARCTQALAVAQYLARALSNYRRDTASGRVPFAIDELLRAGVENTDLIASQPAPHLLAYLEALRRRADDRYASVALVVPRAERPRLRHLLVLAALGRRHLTNTVGHSAFAALKDMLLAWTTARRAAS